MDNKQKRQVLSETLKGVKMHNAGYKPKKQDGDYPCMASSSSDNVVYPSLYLNSKNVPEMKGYDVEDEVLFMIKGKITSHSLNENSKNSRETWDIQIKEIACLNKKDSK